MTNPTARHPDSVTRRDRTSPLWTPDPGPRTFILALLLVGLCTSASLADKDRRGTAGAAHLRVTPTAKLSALGSSGVAGGFGISGVEMLFVNPAGLTLNSGTGLLFSRIEYLVDTEISTLGAAQQIGSNHLGMFINSWNLGDIPRQTELNPEISELTFRPEIITVGASFARQFTDRISAGFTVKMVNEDIDDMGASAVALDGGLTYVIPESGFRFGLSVQNVGSKLQFSGTGLSRKTDVPDQRPDADSNTLYYESEPVDLPALLNFGVSYTRQIGSSARISLLTGFRSNAFDQNQYSGGLEIGFLNAFYLRGGLNYTPDGDLTVFKAGSLGAGLSTELSGLEIDVDYAYRPTDFFSDVQMFTIGVGI